MIANIYVKAGLMASKKVFKVGLHDFEPHPGRRCQRIEDAACILAARVSERIDGDDRLIADSRRDLAEILHVTPATVRVTIRRHADYMKYDREFREKDRAFVDEFDACLGRLEAERNIDGRES